MLLPARLRNTRAVQAKIHLLPDVLACILLASQNLFAELFSLKPSVDHAVAGQLTVSRVCILHRDSSRGNALCQIRHNLADLLLPYACTGILNDTDLRSVLSDVHSKMQAHNAPAHMKTLSSPRKTTHIMQADGHHF